MASTQTADNTRMLITHHRGILTLVEQAVAGATADILVRVRDTDLRYVLLGSCHDATQCGEIDVTTAIVVRIRSIPIASLDVQQTAVARSRVCEAVRVRSW